MRKRMLALLLCMVLCLSLLPTSAFAAVGYDVWIGDVQITSDNCKNVLGDGNVSYNSLEQVLTLKDANISNSIYSNSDLTVFLDGYATIESDGQGITSAKTLTITGDGQLYVNTQKGGLNAADIEIAGDVSLIVASPETSIYSEEDVRITDNSYLFVVSTNGYGISAENSVNIDSSDSVTIISSYDGIDAWYDVSISGEGDLTITSDRVGIDCASIDIYKEGDVDIQAADIALGCDFLELGGTGSITLHAENVGVQTSWMFLNGSGDVDIYGRYYAVYLSYFEEECGILLGGKNNTIKLRSGEMAVMQEDHLPGSVGGRNYLRYEDTGSPDSASVVYTYKPGVVITEQPKNVNAAEPGSVAKYTVVAAGEDLSYQWQYKTLEDSKNGRDWRNCTSLTPGYNTAAIQVTATEARNGYSYRCVITADNGDTATTNAVVLTVKTPALAITAQPKSVTTTEGNTAKFTVAASGTGLSYQWQYKTATGTAWSNSGSTGSKTATLSVGATAARNGFSFRCVIKDANGKSVTSEAAKLTVSGGAPVITKQPVSVSAALDSTAKFTVAASGTGLSYQWQYKTATGTTWSNSGSTGNKTATLSVGATNARNGYSFRCVIKDANGKSVTSEAAKLTVSGGAPVITKQPVSVSAALDSTAKFTVAASGTGLSYQWQYKTATGTAWSNSGSTGSKTATLSVGATAARNGFSFRCVIKDANGKSVTSEAAKLTVSGGAPVITKQPTSVTAALDSTAKFTVAASGTGLSYQWQYKTATGTTWSNSGSTGNKTATLSVGATNARNGFSFRCVIKDADGKSVTSEAAKLTVSGGAPVITKQPTSVTAALDSTAKFTVAATGTGLSYQWQYKTATGTTWSNSGSTGNKTATLSVGATNARNGFSFRCVITDANGGSAITNAVKLTVK